MTYFFKYIFNKILFIPKLIYGIIILEYDVYKFNKQLNKKLTKTLTGKYEIRKSNK